MEISIKRVYQYIVIFLNFYTTSNHLHPLQVGNCDSNSRLVVDEDDNGKFRTERVKVVCRLVKTGIVILLFAWVYQVPFPKPRPSERCFRVVFLDVCFNHVNTLMHNIALHNFMSHVVVSDASIWWKDSSMGEKSDDYSKTRLECQVRISSKHDR